jgi:hypothetical protein
LSWIPGAALVATALALMAPRPTTGAIDPALVGTWKLEYAGPAVFWVVRPDGTYRLHGPGAKPRQFGRMEGSKGRWSVKSDVWADEGNYRLAGPATWIVTGKFGTGTWKQVWKPAEGSPRAVSGSGACRLVTPAEVARVLYSPAAGQEDSPSKAEGCRFRALFSTLDEVTITTRTNVGDFFQNNRKARARSVMDVPGVGDQAFTEHTAGNALTLQFLQGDTWVTLQLRLQPYAMMEDLPYLSELGRAVAGRLPR